MDLGHEHPLDIDENDHARNLLKKLDSMRREQKNCDLVISVEGKKIHVNRDVMCAASDYFDAMFSHDTKERQEGVVEMKDVELSAVEKCIAFIYSGKISVSEGECEGLLYSARLMQLNEVCDKISPFLENRLTSKTFFNIKRIAIKFSLKALIAFCDEFALEKVFELAGEKEFNDQDIDYISFLLSSKKFSGRRIEDCKLCIALQWIKADADNREKYLMKIIELLDPSNLTSGYSRFLVENESLCIKYPEFMRKLYLGIAVTHHVRSTSPPNLSDISLSREMSYPNTLLIFDESSKLVQSYQASESKLTLINAYHSEMAVNFTTCVSEQYLYVLNINQKTLRLNIRVKNSTWTQLADMLYNHGLRLQCTVHDNFIYAGGENKFERTKIEENEEWEDIEVNGNICHHSALVGYGGCVFVVGGYEGGPVANVRKFCPSSSSWMSVKSMNVARQDSSVAVFDSKIYVAGGQGNEKLHDFEMYDIMTDFWTILPKMNSSRSYFGLCVVNNEIFAVGSLLDICSIEVYDLKNGKWIHHNSPTMKMWAPATVAAFIPTK